MTCTKEFMETNMPVEWKADEISQDSSPTSDNPGTPQRGAAAEVGTEVYDEYSPSKALRE